MKIELNSSEKFYQNEIASQFIKDHSYSFSSLKQQAKSEEYSCISSLSHILNSILNFFKRLFCCDYSYTVKNESESEIDHTKFFQSAITQCEDKIKFWMQQAEIRSKDIYFYFKSKSFSMNYFLKYSPNGYEKEKQQKQIFDSFATLIETTENKDFEVHFFLIEDSGEPGYIDYEKYRIDVTMDNHTFFLGQSPLSKPISLDDFQAKITSHFKNVTFQR